METDLNTVSELIDSLDPTAQREILATLSYRFSESRIAEHWTQEERLAFDALVRVSDGQAVPLDVYVVKSRITRRKMKEYLVWLNTFVTDHSGRQLKIVERMAVLNLVAECLADYMRDHTRVPVRPDTLLRSLSQSKAAVSAAFPGAVSARLLDRIALIPVSRRAA